MAAAIVSVEEGRKRVGTEALTTRMNVAFAVDSSKQACCVSHDTLRWESEEMGYESCHPDQKVTNQKLIRDFSCGKDPYEPGSDTYTEQDIGGVHGLLLWVSIPMGRPLLLATSIILKVHPYKHEISWIVSRTLGRRCRSQETPSPLSMLLLPESRRLA